MDNNDNSTNTNVPGGSVNPLTTDAVTPSSATEDTVPSTGSVTPVSSDPVGATTVEPTVPTSSMGGVMPTASDTNTVIEEPEDTGLVSGMGSGTTVIEEPEDTGLVSGMGSSTTVAEDQPSAVGGQTPFTGGQTPDAGESDEPVSPVGGVGSDEV
jgi:hypothetical protein